MRVAGKVAIVTGANAGIGAAIANVLAEEGAAVVVTGRRKDLLDQVVAGIERKKGRALAVAGSVTDEPHVRSAVDQCVRTFGALHILVNNAGIGARFHPEDLPLADFERVLQTGVTGSL
nr:SDR family NAD(P)-dependent oxidoreductase [Nitrospira sp.]